MATVAGTNGNDNLTAQATSAADTIQGLGGNDILFGGGGVDILNGGAGDDRFDITAAADIAAGESYTGGTGFDTLNITVASPLDISALTIAADVEALTSTGALSLSSTQLDRFVSLNTGALTLTSGGTVDLANARSVTTTVFNLFNANTVFSLNNVSTANYTVNGGTGNDIITGGAKNDTLNGGDGNDTLNGGSGNDILTGGAGLDTVNGGAGNDRIVITAQSEIGQGEIASGGTGIDELYLNSSAAIDLSQMTINADVETLTAFGTVSLTAAQLSAFSRVQAANVTLSTGGTVTMSNDTVATGTFNLHSSGNTITLAGARSGIYTVNGSGAADTITGGDFASFGDTLNGFGGDDTINGGMGDDFITGGLGKDTMNGGNGNDTFLITGPSDVVALELYNGGEGLDTIRVTGSSPVNLSAATINVSTERLIATTSVQLSALQAGAFRFIDTGNNAVTLTSTGTVSFTGDTVFSSVFNLFSGGNSITFAGQRFAQYTVTGGTGADTITGGDHILGDNLTGGDGNDVLTGGAGHDTLYGGNGKDTVSGGTGDDTILIQSAGEVVAAESIAGGTGWDTVIYNGATDVSFAGITLNSDLEALVAQNYGAVLSMTATQLANFEFLDTGRIAITTTGTIALTSGEIYTQEFTLSAGGNTLNLTDVDDEAYTVYGGAGNDTIWGGEVASGDFLFGNGGNDTLYGNAGDDELTGGAGVDTYNGGQGDDTFFITATGEVVTGTTSTGAVTREIFNGDEGFDEINITTTATIDLSIATISADVEGLRAAGGVTLSALQLDRFSSLNVAGAIGVSTTGNIVLAGATISDLTVNLNSGGNTIDFLGAADGRYTVNGGAAVDTINGGDHWGGDTLNGNGGNDVLNGKGGNDVLNGGAGADVVNGDEGDDTFLFTDQTHIVTGDAVNGGAGFDWVSVQASGAINITALNIGADVEGLLSNTALTVTAAQLDRFAQVSTGAITLSAAGVVDLTGATVTTTAFNLSAAGNTLNLSGAGDASYTVTGGAAVDIVTGGDLADTLNGAGGNDTLNGGAGDDVLNGGAGIDTLNGDAGNDRFVISSQADIGAGESYTGGDGVDTLDVGSSGADISSITLWEIETITGGPVSMTAGQASGFSTLNTGAVTLTTTGAVTLSDNVSTLTTMFILNAGGNSIDLSGQNGASYIVTGGAGVDTITGGDLGDQLTGGGGNDTLLGGGGADQFRFNSTASGADRILDFSGATAFSGGAGDGDDLVFQGLLSGAFSYVGAAAFANNGNSQARFGGANTLQIDTNGNGVADITITLDGFTSASQITGSDFVWL
jgi:Ca2+-binding RTX toxin-like protein